ncbi:hypothetical protein D0962_33380 [Leptolyngbyaceae cyanobacterium CCMR0082]|uniref:Uncharacterized protein n=1 Tax=Adonisia turfae CCMR0082 TaxID=2304604 RepID=A0A6M0SGF2_9CYAN|nr:hypothetical protein [Adonisia turfae CCMR0082]
MYMYFFISLAVGFLSGMCVHAATIIFRSERRDALLQEKIRSTVLVGLLWSIAFLTISSIVYLKENAIQQSQLLTLILKIGIGLPLISIIFELCYSAVRNHSE